MHTLLLLSCLCQLLPAPAPAEAPLIRARLYLPPSQADDLERLGFDLLALSADAIDLAVSDEEWRELVLRGYQPVFIERGRPMYEIQANRGESYPDLAEVEGIMAETAASYPNICKMVDLTTTYGAPATFEGRHLYALKISDNVNLDENEPSMLVVSTHHARELVTPVIALLAIERFTSQYGLDPDLTAIVDENELWIAPVWNPDGYNEVFAGNNFWRKNRRVFPSGIGVDTNRNYRTGWETGCSGSTSPSSETYKGPSAGSEAETQTMEVFTAVERFARILDFHSFGREALYSYLCLSHPQNAWFQAEANRLATACGYGNATRVPSADGEHYQWQLTHLAYAFLIETHDDFQPAYNSAVAEAQAVFPSIVTMAERPAALWGTVRDTLGQPLEATITFEGIAYSNGEQLTSGGPHGRYDAFVAPGTYQVHFSAKGKQEQVHQVTVQNAVATHLDIVLQPESSFCSGDFNQDFSIDLRDMAALINALAGSDLTFDLDHSGAVDLDDLQTLIPTWGTCP